MGRRESFNFFAISTNTGLACVRRFDEADAMKDKSVTRTLSPTSNSTDVNEKNHASAQNPTVAPVPEPSTFLLPSLT